MFLLYKQAKLVIPVRVLKVNKVMLAILVNKERKG